MSKIKTRYFTMKLKNGKILNIEPPKLKVLKKISALSKIEETGELKEKDIENLSEAVSLALSKNKQKFKITAEQVEDDYDIDEILSLLNNYFEWINSTHNEKN